MWSFGLPGRKINTPHRISNNLFVLRAHATGSVYLYTTIYTHPRYNIRLASDSILPRPSRNKRFLIIIFVEFNFTHPYIYLRVSFSLLRRRRVEISYFLKVPNKIKIRPWPARPRYYTKYIYYVHTYVYTKNMYTSYTANITPPLQLIPHTMPGPVRKI